MSFQAGVTRDELIEFLNIAITEGGCPGEQWALKAYQTYKELQLGKEIEEEVCYKYEDIKVKHDDFRLKPEPNERAKRIFQGACDIENMEAKFGRTLFKDENDIRRFILKRSPVMGRIPSLDEIRKEFYQFQEEKINAIMNKLDHLDVIHLNKDKKSILAAYPFSDSKTSHKVSPKKLGFKRVYAMCAIDALGISFMFDCDVSIESLCGHCGENIEIEVKDNEITFLNPRNPVVWCDMEYSSCAATSLCKNTNFFSSEMHFEEWQKGKSRRKGNLLQIQEAFYLGKLFFENRLKD